uniref:Endo/exonuclease/phosphatase domain-containing protein n=1 Tax=Parastrongyloides trichosuri TaxID=131310 RepID=A0A0N4ZV06_PARTI
MEFNPGKSTRPPTQKEIDEFVKNTKSHPDIAVKFLSDCNNSVEWACLLFFQVSDELYEEKGVDVQKECEDILTDANKPSTSKKAKIEEIGRSENLDFGLISWNVNGISRVHEKSRIKGIIKKIDESKPEVIFFQELNPTMAEILNKYLGPLYNIIYEDDDFNPNSNYFTAICIVNNLKVLGKDFIPFRNSHMGRGCHLVKINLLNRKIALLNTHLESGKESSDTRVKQIKWCVDKMEELKQRGYDVIFGGDLNIRADEAKNIVPEKFDCFVKGGKPSKYNYTWRGEEIILKKSDRPYVPKARFDRLYHVGAYLHLSSYEHTGFEWLQKQDCALSDHLGIFVNFKFKPSDTPMSYSDNEIEDNDIV